MTQSALPDPNPSQPPSHLRIWIWFVLDLFVAAAMATPFFLQHDSASAATVLAAVLSAAPRPKDDSGDEGSTDPAV